MPRRRGSRAGPPRSWAFSPIGADDAPEFLLAEEAALRHQAHHAGEILHALEDVGDLAREIAVRRRGYVARDLDLDRHGVVDGWRARKLNLELPGKPRPDRHQARLDTQREPLDPLDDDHALAA